MTLIAVLEIDEEQWGMNTVLRKHCAHGLKPHICLKCCDHGRRLDTMKLRPCPECPCPTGREPHPHAWELLGPAVPGEAAALRCMKCGAVKR